MNEENSGYCFCESGYLLNSDNRTCRGMYCLIFGLSSCKLSERNYIDVVLQILMNVRKLNHVNRTAQTQKGPLNVDVL